MKVAQKKAVVNEFGTAMQKMQQFLLTDGWSGSALARGLFYKEVLRAFIVKCDQALSQHSQGDSSHAIDNLQSATKSFKDMGTKCPDGNETGLLEWMVRNSAALAKLQHAVQKALGVVATHEKVLEKKYAQTDISCHDESLADARKDAKDAVSVALGLVLTYAALTLLRNPDIRTNTNLRAQLESTPWSFSMKKVTWSSTRLSSLKWNLFVIPGHLVQLGNSRSRLLPVWKLHQQQQQQLSLQPLRLQPQSMCSPHIWARDGCRGSMRS